MSVTSINSSSYNVAQLSQTQQNFAPRGMDRDGDNDGSRIGGQGKKPPFGDAISQALSQAGVTSTQGNSNLDSFMKNLFDALRSQNSSSTSTGTQQAQGSDADGDNDGSTSSVKGKHKHRGGGQQAFQQDLASLLQKVSSGDSSDPAVAKLQEAFQSLVGSNSSTTLKDFLTSLSSNVQNASSASGNVINTQA